MKRLSRRASSLSIAAALASAAAGVQAQSSVTLYGIVDAGIAVVHNAQDTSRQNQSTAALRAGVGYNYTLLTGPVSAHYNQVNIGGDYALSKRTELYALAGWQKASGHTLNAKGAAVDAQASIGDFGVNSGTDTQALAVVGIRHKF